MATEILRLELHDYVIRERFYPPGLRMPRHSHDHSNVTVVISGMIEEAGGAGEHCGRSGSAVIKPAGSEHENRVGGFGVRTLSIERKRAAGPDGQLARRPYTWVEEIEVVRHAISLRRAIATVTGIDATVHQLIAAVLSSKTRAIDPPQWFHDVKRILDVRFDDGDRFETIAAEFGLHPVCLSRAFRRYAGVSMQAYRRDRRLRRACDLLTTSTRSLTSIAADSGFADLSHLSHTFARILDVTPNGYRRLCGRV